jgi:hypothetical protein
MTSMGVQGVMMDQVDAEGWEGKVVLLRVYGTLSQGRPADVGIPAAREVLLDRGALAVYVSRAGLRGADGRGPDASDVPGDGMTDPILVANDIIARRVGEHETKLKWLSGGEGELFARDLLEVLKRERGGRKVDDHKEALLRDSLALMDLPAVMGGEES